MKNEKVGVTLIEKTSDLSKFEVVKYQLIHHCFMKNIRLNHTDLDCLSLLGELGSIRISEFCKIAVEREFLGSESTVSNCLNKLEKSQLFLKKGAGKKMIFLNPDLNIKSEGNILIKLNLIKRETVTAAGNIPQNSAKTQSA